MFDSFHRYLGVAVGECLGYLLTGAWTLLVAVAMLQSSSFDDWLAWPGMAVGALLVVGSLEFVGRFEEHGCNLAATIVPIAYTAWSLWLFAPESCSSPDYRRPDGSFCLDPGNSV